MSRRMRFASLALLSGVVAVLPALALAQSASDAPPRRIVGYFISWGIYDRQYLVTDVPADMLTHLNYAFANISSDGEVIVGDPEADTDRVFDGDDPDAPLHGNFHQLQLLKEQHPNLQTLISIGGWTWSGKFSDVAATPEARERFARSAVDFMLTYGFDGVDIDWEYPAGGGLQGNHERPEDPQNFVLLLHELRRQLDAQGDQDGRHYLLTIAAGAGEQVIAPLDWEAIHPSLDWINVMAYDMVGSYSDITGHHAPLFDSAQPPPEGASADSAIRLFLEAGVPADKLVLGVPFYGHSFGGVAAENDGLHQPFTSIGPGTWEPGWVDYHDIAANYADAAHYHYDETAQAPWLYDPVWRRMITYDDPTSLAAKTAYVRDNGLGGIMFWELSQDTADHVLLRAIHDGLNAS